MRWLKCVFYCLLFYALSGSSVNIHRKSPHHRPSSRSLCLRSEGNIKVALLAKKELSEISRRYGLRKSLGCLDFLLSAHEMEELVKSNGLPILVKLMGTPNLPVFLKHDLIQAAIVLGKGNVDMNAHGKYFAKLLGYRYELFVALEKTVQKQKIAEHDARMIAKTLSVDPNHFVSNLKKLQIHPKAKARWIKAFSLCAHGYLDNNYRNNMRRVVIEKPISKYNHPHMVGRLAPQSTEQILHEKKDDLALNSAFRLLVNNIDKVANEQKLNDFDKACMAKCIADEILIFKSANNYPFLTIPLFYASVFESGAKNMILANGLCINYATITNTLLKSLNFAGLSELATNGLHYFNVVTIGGQRYHFHPMRKYGKDCSFFPMP